MPSGGREDGCRHSKQYRQGYQSSGHGRSRPETTRVAVPWARVAPRFPAYHRGSPGGRQPGTSDARKDVSRAAGWRTARNASPGVRRGDRPRGRRVGQDEAAGPQTRCDPSTPADRPCAARPAVGPSASGGAASVRAAMPRRARGRTPLESPTPGAGPAPGTDPDSQLLCEWLGCAARREWTSRARASRRRLVRRARSATEAQHGVDGVQQSTGGRRENRRCRVTRITRHSNALRHLA
jgi:hypothetical protein